MGFFSGLGKIAKTLVGLSPLGSAFMAQRSARKEQKHQEHMLYEAGNRARDVARKQGAERAALQRRMSASKVRSSRRGRVRGGLFGGAGESSESSTATLGG